MSQSTEWPARLISAGLILLLSLFALAPPAARAAAGPAEGTFVYDILQGTSAIGSSTMTISQPGGETVVSEKAALSGHGSVSAVSRFDAMRDLRSFTGDYRSEGRSDAVSVSAAFAKDQLTLNAPSGEVKRVAIPGTQRFLVLDGALMTDLALAPWRFGDRPRNYLTFVSPSSASEDETVLVRDDTAARPSGLTSAARCLVVANPVVAFVWYEPGDAIAREIDIPSQGLRVKLRPR